MARKTTTASNGRTGNHAGTQRPHVDVPVIGTLTLPAPDRLVFYGVLGVLGALEIVEWPVVLIVGLGHYLTEQRHSPVLREAGQAAEAA